MTPARAWRRPSAIASSTRRAASCRGAGPSSCACIKSKSGASTVACGGTGAGLIAFLDASLIRGAPLVVQTAGLDQALKGADLVITGEGRIDAQTAFGKAPGEVARRAQAAGVPVLFLAGTRGPGWDSLD